MKRLIVGVLVAVMLAAVLHRFRPSLMVVNCNSWWVWVIECLF